MNQQDFEQRMREREYFHSLRLVPGTWTVVRVDGRSFSRFTATHYEKPFDQRFHEHMLTATQALLEELQGVYAYTSSDEASIALPPAWDLFDREVEKVVSLSAGIVSSHFSLASGLPAHFDARIWVGTAVDEVVDYFRWRQSDAARCALNGWAYWMLRKTGLSEKQAGDRIHRLGPAEKNELLFQHGVNFNDTPLWQRRGAGLAWETYEKAGTHPLHGTPTVAQRRRVRRLLELPMKDEYGAFVRALLEPRG